VFGSYVSAYTSTTRNCHSAKIRQRSTATISSYWISCCAIRQEIYHHAMGWNDEAIQLQ